MVKSGGVAVRRCCNRRALVCKSPADRVPRCAFGVRAKASRIRPGTVRHRIGVVATRLLNGGDSRRTLPKQGRRPRSVGHEPQGRMVWRVAAAGVTTRDRLSRPPRLRLIIRPRGRLLSPTSRRYLRLVGGATGCLRPVIPALMGRVPGPLGAPAVGVAPVVEVVAEITRRRGGVTCSGLRLLRVWSQRGR